MLKEFKRKILERSVPLSVLYLNRIVKFLLLLVLILSIVEFITKINTKDDLKVELDQSFDSLYREYLFASISTGMSTFVAIKNNLEPNNLGPYLDRTAYLHQKLRT